MAYTKICKQGKKEKNQSRGAKMSKSKNFFWLNFSSILDVNLMAAPLPSKVVLNIME